MPGWRLNDMKIQPLQGHEHMLLCWPVDAGEPLPDCPSAPHHREAPFTAKTFHCPTDYDFQKVMHEVNMNEAVAGSLVADFVGFDVKNSPDGGRDVALFFKTCSGGSLRSLMGAPDDVLIRLMYSSAVAVLSLHNASPEGPVAHRCVSVDHLLLVPNGTMCCDEVVLCDLRSASSTAYCDLSTEQLRQARIDISYSIPSDLIAPEMISLGVGCGRVDEKVDAWQLGHTFFELMYGCSPFTSVPHKCRGIVTIPRGSAPHDKSFLQLITRLLHPIPSKRMTVHELTTTLGSTLKRPVPYPPVTRPQPSHFTKTKSPLFRTTQSTLQRFVQRFIGKGEGDNIQQQQQRVPPPLRSSFDNNVADVPVPPPSLGEPPLGLPSPLAVMGGSRAPVLMENYWKEPSNKSGKASTSSWDILSHHTLDDYDVVVLDEPDDAATAEDDK